MKKNHLIQAKPARDFKWLDVLWITATALLYFLAARFSHFLVFKPVGIEAIWPPSGIFLSAILLTRKDARPYLVGALFTADLIAENLAGTSFVISLAYAVSLTMDAVLSAWLLTRFVGGPILFRKVRELAGFLFLSVFLSNTLSSFVVAISTSLYHGSPFWSSWFWWGSSHAVGNLLVTPLIISWAFSVRTLFKEFNWGWAVEYGILFSSMIFLNDYAFSYFNRAPWFALFLSFFSFPFLIWASFRFGMRGATTTSFILAIMILWHTLNGGLLFLSSQPILTNIILVQIYIAMVSIPSLLLAVLFTEYKHNLEETATAGADIHALFMSMQDLVMVFDRDGFFRNLAPTNMALLAKPLEGMLGQNLRDIFPADQADSFIHMIQQVLETQSTAHIEYQLVIDNRPVWFETAVSPMDGGRTIWVAREITKRKLAEVAYRESTEREQRHLLVAKNIEDITRSLRVAENSTQLLSLLLGKLVKLYPMEYAAAFLLKDRKITLASTLGDKIRGEFELSGVTKLRELLLVKKPQLVDGRFLNLKDMVLILPFVAQENILGGLLLDWSQHQQLDDSGTHIFNTLMDIIGTALQRTGLVESLEHEVQKRTRELSILYAISAVANSSLEIKKVLERSLEQSLTMMKMERGIIYLLESDRNLHVAAHRGFSEKMLRGLNLDGGDPFAREVVRKKTPVIVNDLASDAHMRQHMLIDVRSYAAIPILSNGQLMGVFCVSSNLDLEDSTSSLLSAVSDRIGMALENAMLYSRLREVATVETRQKLARDLHDSVTQSLYSMVLMTTSTKKLLEGGENMEEVKRSTERVGEIAHQTLKEMRLLLYELRPLKLEHDGLINALRQRVDTVESRSGIKVRTKIDELPPLPLNVEEHLYHIAMEALNNILKHSGSPDADLELYAENGNIILKVSDHGKGFDVKEAGSGMGLADMRERVQILGGKFSIDAEPGSGTCLCVEIKCVKDQQDFAERMPMYENPNPSSG